MDDYQNEAMPVGAAEVAAATQTLQRYKAGKAALDRRLVDNELWFRMGHWKNYQMFLLMEILLSVGRKLINGTMELIWDCSTIV